MGKLKLRTVGAFVVLCQFLQLSEGAISFTKEPDNPSDIKKGNNATLIWDYNVTDRQTELKFIIWAVFINQKFTNLVVEYKNRDRVVLPGIPSAYKGRIGITGKASLVIENITFQDSTTFRCTLRAEPSTGLQDQISVVRLVVTDVPRIIISQLQLTYNEGSAVSIICTASGTPDPDVQWIRIGQVITSGKKTASLKFNGINRTDHGLYTCKATNSAGNDEKQVMLVVNYMPEGTTLNTSAAGNTFTQGVSVTFTCGITAAKPQVSQYKFYLNDTTLVKNSSNNQYTIDSVQRSQHYGKYKCVPHNAVGDGTEATVTLNVNIPVLFSILPQNLTVNETNPIVVSCDASGFPEPSFTWTKDGQVVSQAKQLNIQRSNRGNAGMYVCTASNGVGHNKTAKVYVTVQFPPTIKEVTASASKSWIGQTVKLKCVSDGVPTPTLTWYKPDESQINSVKAKKNMLDVMMKEDEDFGSYKCDADNGLNSTDFKIVKIKQIKMPGSPAIAQLDIQATSLTVRWTAPVDDGGSPIIAYRVVILKGSTEIKEKNVTDLGTTSWKTGGLDRDTEYTLKVFARNAVFEGIAVEKAIKTKYEGVPAAAKIDELPNEVTDNTITLKWSEPQNNGKEITQYTVYQRLVTNGTPESWIKLNTITNASVREWKVELESGKVYQFVVTATNELGESFKEDGKIVTIKASQKSEGDDGSQTGDGDEGNGMGPAIYAGAAAAGVLLIIGIIVIIVLWRRRKPSSDEDTSRDELGSANPYEVEDGYHSVSREAAQSLQASGPAAEPNYALVDQSKKKKNRMPANDEYAQVDKSKKTKKKKKKPGELDYADLEDLRADIQLGPVPSGGAAAAAPIVRPPAYEGTEYADISQFGVPRPDPTYANVPKQEVVYSNVESM